LCNSKYFEKRGFRNGKQRYRCKECGRDWTSNEVTRRKSVKPLKTEKLFLRENTLEEIINYLKSTEANGMPLQFWYRDDIEPRNIYDDYFIDEKYVNVLSEKGYYIKFLIDKIRKI
jgi:hypothetical protein